ncbi:MAG: tetratricopeptide repeat protein [Vicinamibacteria bacterium]|nr:tetratricopeptide repeat protein [Vicinamibacteria bacterium]
MKIETCKRLGVVVAAALFLSPIAWLACRTAHTAPMRLMQANPAEQGKTLFDQGKYAEAETQLRQASGNEARAYLAACLAKQMKLEEAEGVASATLEAQPDNRIAVAALGEALVKQEKADAAIERMSAAIKDMPDLAYAYYWRGKAYNLKKQTARMVDDLQSFIKLAPKAPEADAVKQLLAALQ